MSDVNNSPIPGGGPWVVVWVYSDTHRYVKAYSTRAGAIHELEKRKGDTRSAELVDLSDVGDRLSKIRSDLHQGDN